MKLRSHAHLYKDFDTRWYTHWAELLKQEGPDQQLDGFMPRSNKFWQNAALCQALSERGMLKSGRHGMGFGVGNERLPALFARYGISVTATDQDHRTKKAKHWSKGELATGLQSLNKYGITSDSSMKELVDYRPMDMNIIPDEHAGRYDFIWSNCALGHLGSLQKGLDFIENSLSCLKPGGVAVHTTELNILSDNDTVESGDTVVFRQSDIAKLYTKLTAKGYQCMPLTFTLGRTKSDMSISMFPQFGNDSSKIQVHGQLATQVILIIQKPLSPPPPYLKSLYLMQIRRAHKRGLKEIQEFARLNTQIQQLSKYSDLDTTKLQVVPEKSSVKVSLKKKDKPKTVYITYQNDSEIDLYCLNGTPLNCNPVVLATDDPQDRESIFFNKHWYAKNRPSGHLHAPTSKSPSQILDYVPAGERFSVPITLQASSQSPGKYQENVTLVMEGRGWIPLSKVTIDIDVQP